MFFGIYGAHRVFYFKLILLLLFFFRCNFYIKRKPIDTGRAVFKKDFSAHNSRYRASYSNNYIRRFLDTASTTCAVISDYLTARRIEQMVSYESQYIILLYCKYDGGIGRRTRCFVTYTRFESDARWFDVKIFLRIRMEINRVKPFGWTRFRAEDHLSF